MAVTIATSPTYPTTKAPARVTFILTGGGNFVRVWCTDAPEGSKLKTELTSTEQSRILAFEGGAADVWTFAPDKGGVFVFAAQEYTRGASAYGGGYKGDPRGYPTETKIGSESTLNTLRVGQRLEMPIGVKGDTATLVTWVWDINVRETSAALHGEVTPALVNPKSERARTAIALPTVTAALDQLATVGNAVTLLGDASTIATNIIDKFNAHRTQAGKHDANDADNVIAASFRNPSTEAAWKLSVAEILRMLDRHMRNDNSAGTGSAAYHKVGGIVLADWTDGLVAGPPGDIPGVITALADAWRAYEAHRVNTLVHVASDTTNTLTALPKLHDLHRAWLAALQPTGLTVPATANSGAVVLIHGAGMKESNQ